MVPKKRAPKKKSEKKSRSKAVVKPVKNSPEKASDRQHHIDMALEAAQVGIWEWFMKTDKVRWSNIVYKIFGVTKKEFNGDLASYRKLIHPEDREVIALAIQETLANRKIYFVQHRVIWPDGTIKWIEASGNGIWNKQDELVKLTGTAQDITERKKIDEELRESEQRFRTLQQASFGGIGIHDKGLIIDCNQGLSDITGFSRDELVGSDGLRLVAPEWRDHVMGKILEGAERHYDVEGVRKDGSRYSLEVQAKNIPYQGKMIRVTEFRDITERKLTEAKIMEQNSRLISITEDLKRKNEQLEEFTQIVSHNLRSPVGNILTLISFFETTEKEEEKAEYMTLLKESGNTTQRTLHELNEVLKIKQNKNIPRQDLQFDQVLQRVKSMLSAKITEASAIIESDFSQAPAILYPNIYMESIFLNLLSNSLKYSHADRTPVIVFKTFHSNSNSNSNIILEVSDNGLGINLDRYSHQVFKLHKTFHRHPESRGIGLFMIKNQIEALGGEISIASQVDKGTTIFVNFNKYNFDAVENSDNSASG